MPSKIFVNYRRDDDPNGAARVRDGLAARFGAPNVFMDVDDLLAGQRFDEELAKALSQCDVLIAVIGLRWMELLKARAANTERDYVREEIAVALSRKVIVIPVRVGRDGQLPPLPRQDDLPEDIRDLVLYQKHDVAHERFGRDIAELIEAIVTIRRTNRLQMAAPRVPWGWIGATAASLLAIGYAGAYYSGIPVRWPGGPPSETRVADAAARAKVDEKGRAGAAEVQPNPPINIVVPANPGSDCEGVSTLVGKEMRCLNPHDLFQDCKDCPQMVVIPKGTISIGPNMHPALMDDILAGAIPQKASFPVNIARPFAAGRTELTFKQWEFCVQDKQCHQISDDAGFGRSERPVVNVSWDDAQQFIAWLSAKTKAPYRLPSESEWEYMARAGSEGLYFFGDDPADLCVFGNGADQSIQDIRILGGAPRAPCSDGSGPATLIVGSKRPNKFGLYDIHGNVSEWVADCWLPGLIPAIKDGQPAKAINGADCSRRGHRGGSWRSSPIGLRTAFRNNGVRSARGSDIGFRVVRDLF